MGVCFLRSSLTRCRASLLGRGVFTCSCIGVGWGGGIGSYWIVGVREWFFSYISQEELVQKNVKTKTLTRMILKQDKI